MQSPTQAIGNTFRALTGNPLIASIMFGIPVAYVTHKLRNPLHRLAYNSVANVPGQTGYLLQKGVDLVFSDKNYSKIPWITGGVTAATIAALNFDADQPLFGLGSWKMHKAAKFHKTASILKYADLWNQQGYQPQVPLNMPVSIQSVDSMLKSNPYLQDNRYLANLGSSIVNGAYNIGGQSTLGNIYDSAVNKFDTKMKFDGIGSTATRALVSGGLAGMFTDVVGTVIGLPLPALSTVSRGVGVGSALLSILG